MKIEVLTFEVCPNAQVARELVERVLADSPVDAERAHVNIPDSETAEQVRFLGLPTIRVDGSGHRAGRGGAHRLRIRLPHLPDLREARLAHPTSAGSATRS